MNAWDVLIPLAALALGLLIARRRREPPEPPAAQAKILFPFVGTELSDRALQAAIRIARAQNAVIVPGYLARVPQRLPLDVPLGRACDEAFSVFEAIEQRAAGFGVPVDGRIARGRNVRHALRTLMADVPTARRIVVAASNGDRHDGFGVDDIAWLLRNAHGEVLVVRPDPQDAVEPPERARAAA
jgi:hypothetical protein